MIYATAIFDQDTGLVDIYHPDGTAWKRNVPATQFHNLPGDWQHAYSTYSTSTWHLFDQGWDGTITPKEKP